MFLKKFLTLFCLFILISTRTDEVLTTLHVSSIPDVEGTWITTELCPVGTWGSGFNTFGDCKSNGIVYLKLDCSNQKGVYQTSAQNTDGGDWSKSSWQTTLDQYCDSGIFFTKFALWGTNSNWVQNYGLSGIRFYCSSGSGQPFTSGDPCNDGSSWSSVVGSCPIGTAICGYYYRFDIYQSSHDNTALTDLYIYCCRICSPQSSVYQSGTNCNFCPISCLTCSGSSSSSCLTCSGTDILTASTCVPDTSLIVVSEDFTGASLTSISSDFNTVALGWSGTKLTKQCGSWYMIGDYDYTYNSNLKKSLTNLMPHYKARIKARYYKLGNWQGQGCLIIVDGITLLLSSLLGWQSADNSFYYGDICGSGNSNTVFIDKEFSHNTPTITIQFTSTLTSTGMTWGISHVGLYVYRCHPTCKLCTGGSGANQCNACYDYATLSSSNTCACNSGYFTTTHSPCTLEPCTVCTECYTGCLTCTDNTINHCASCATGYYYYNNQVLFINIF